MAVLLLAVVFDLSVKTPSAVFLVPVVLEPNGPCVAPYIPHQTAVFLVPVVFALNEPAPTPVLLLAVLTKPASLPIQVQLSAVV